MTTPLEIFENSVQEKMDQQKVQIKIIVVGRKGREKRKKRKSQY